MRRYLFVILFALTLLLPFALRRVLMRSWVGLQTHHDDLKLVVITSHMQDIRREYARAFDQWHREHFGQGVQIVYLTPGGTNDIQRQLETTYRQQRNKKGNLPQNFQADIDVVWGGGDYFFDRKLKPLGVLQPIPLDKKILTDAFPQSTLGGVALYDQGKGPSGNSHPKWIGVVLSSFGIVYNPDLYRAMKLAAPQTWSDLTNPKLAGMVALADPSHSASAATSYLMVLQRAMEDESLGAKGEVEYQSAVARGWKKGMGQLLLMAANARYFTDSSSQVPNDVGNGEAAAGVAIDFYGRVFQESVGPGRCRFITPIAATTVTPDPVGILAGVKGQRLQTAARFVEFLLTPQAQRLWNLKAGTPGGPLARSLRRMPIRRDVYSDQTGWADRVNPFIETGSFRPRKEWTDLLGDTYPLWCAAWIDSRDVLKESYRNILSVKDPSRRAQRIAELADLPIEMTDVTNLHNQRKAIDEKDVDLWKAKVRIEWATKFRTHYARVAAEAK